MTSILSSYVDGHCDTIVKLAEENKSLWKNNCHLDLERLTRLNAPVQVFALWLDPRYYAAALLKTMTYIDFFYQEISHNKQSIAPVYTYEDILINKKQHKISALLSLEGGEALEGELGMLNIYHRLGVRMMTLTWNHRNAIADGVGEEQTGGGLTKFGRQVVERMQSMGMIVDVSHLSHSGFWDVQKRMKKPFIASHSNAKAVCARPRNLSDDALKAVADSGGVVGLNLYPPFLREEGEADLSDIWRHLDHMLYVAGEDFVALGGDLDGVDCLPKGIAGVQDYPYFLEQIEKRYGTKIGKKIAEDNFMRVLREVLC